jgi:hypothetical protein
MNYKDVFMGTKKRILGLFLLFYVVSVYAQVPKTLLDFTRKDVMSYVRPSDAKFELRDNRLRVHTGHNENWPGVTIQPPDGLPDCTGYQKITARIKNLSAQAAQVNLRVDNPGADGIKNCVTDSVSIEPGRTEIVTVNIYPSQWTFDEPVELVGLRGYPQPALINPAKINQMLFFVNKPVQDYQFEISDVRVEGSVGILKKGIFFPFIDSYGQFMHADWPGKIHSQSDFEVSRQAESKDLVNHAGLPDCDLWGGWTKGPKQKATGFFHVEKVDNQWWLVDPEGYLFWSHGVDCVQNAEDTPTTSREKYFQWLPEENDPDWKTCWGRGIWAPVGYYKDKGEYRRFNFAGANLIRKYGKDWFAPYSELCHQRFKSWGINTIGNWSDPAIYRLRKTPYVATLGFQSRLIEGSEGYWGKFPDPFDASFREHFKAAILGEKDKSINDPWCIGFFVHNELAWGDEMSLALAALSSPADQPAKIEFVNYLTQKYSTVERLNQAWGGTYASWKDLLQNTALPDKEKCALDLKTFYAMIAQQYFKVIRDELKASAPNQLYLGCRFAWANDLAVRASAQYCEVVSFNRYEYSVAKLTLPAGIDKPVIIGEFHFGALDRGMFHTGLKVTKDQNDRAQKYKEYVLGALRNPFIVGTHWFQYRDQATTGRGDGENYQIGLVDICDTPYPETIDAVRQTGLLMYDYRYTTSRIK